MSSNVLEFCGLTDDVMGMDIDEMDQPMFVVSEEARRLFTDEEISSRVELTKRWFETFAKNPKVQ